MSNEGTTERNWDTLVQSCPLIFKSGDGYYFECQLGWYDLLFELCQKIEALVVAMPEAERYYEWEEESIREERSFTVEQVKEKFATLRFYMSDYPEGAEKLIADAEYKSANTCEVCGDPGEPRKTGWLKTYCDSHYDSFLQDRKKQRERIAQERAEKAKKNESGSE